MDALQAQVDEFEEKLRKEKAEHNDTKEEVEDLKNKVNVTHGPTSFSVVVHTSAFF